MDLQMKILVVEDFDIIRKKEVEVLKELGFSHIIQAENGQTGIEKIRENPDIALIISDWNMPGIDGYAFLEWLRANETGTPIPFIMATAQGESRQTRKALDAGATAFITKPFTPGELEDVIRQAVGETASEVETVRAEGGDINPRLRSPGETASEAETKPRLRAAHIQITDHLALGVLAHMIAKGSLSPQYFELETVCMPGWNPVRRSLETGEADAAFILAPIAMDLFSVKTPIRLILFAHRNGSICVRGRTKARGKTLRESLKSGVLLLPHILSVHHMLANMFLREIGLKLGPVGQKGADVFYEVVPPVKMPECLATQPDACGFVVAEPLGSKSIAEGHADLMFLSGELWENHPCCVVAMRQAFIEAHPDAAYEFVEMLVTAGRFIYEEPDQSALLAVDFLDPNKVMNLSSSLLASVLKEPRGLKTDDMLPVVDDLDRIQRYMSDIMGIGTLVDLEKFVDDRFAQAACARLPQTKRPSVIHDPSLIVAGMINRQMRGEPDQGVFQAVEEGDSLNFIISSEARMVDRLVDETRTFLKKVGIQNFSEINLVMRELLLNAIEHGNQNDPGRKVTCQVSKFLEDVIKITVSDEGQGFNYQKLNMTPPADATQTRHRGYAIVRAFSKKIEFNARGNQVSVYIKTQQETHFKVREEDGWQIIHPNGDITAAVADRFRRLLHGLVEKGHRRFRFDLEKVRDMDSISLSVFIVLHKVLGTREHDLEMINVCGDLFNLFNMMHLNQTYRIVGEVRKEL